MHNTFKIGGVQVPGTLASGLPQPTSKITYTISIQFLHSIPSSEVRAASQHLLKKLAMAGKLQLLKQLSAEMLATADRLDLNSCEKRKKALRHGDPCWQEMLRSYNSQWRLQVNPIEHLWEPLKNPYRNWNPYRNP